MPAKDGSCRYLITQLHFINRNHKYMAILGNIIKAALEITDRVMPEATPVKSQKEELKNLLEKAANTRFGRHYGFSGILRQNDLAGAFAEAVPFHDYNAMHSGWWKEQMEEGTPDITWPGKVTYYAMSAGTTGKESKRIPVTENMLEAVRKTSIMQILSTANFDFPAAFYEKEIMMLGSSTDLKKVRHYREGEISGIAAGNIPPWFERFYRPGKEIAVITDWDKRVDAIAREAKNWDIGAMAGIPSWNELMMKRVIEANRAESIHDIWPNLRVFVSGGVAFDPYRKSFESLTRYPLTFIDTYLASEGFLAYQSRPNKDMAMTLSTNSGIYFEFVPFREEYIDEDGSLVQGAESFGLEEVETGQDYVLVISTVAGTWRYMIGDTIRFTDKEKAEIVITGRTKHFLNVVGSQLSVIQMNQAMRQLEDRFGLKIPEFTVAAVRPEDEYIHQWYLGVEGEAGEQEVTDYLDQILKETNKAYKMAREQALRDVRVKMVPPRVFYEWIERQKAKGGQVKFPRVMTQKKFREWQEYADKA